MAAAEASKEGVWLRQLLNDIGYAQEQPTPIYEDNETCIAIASDGGALHERTKHIDMRHHYIRELVAGKYITLVPCTTKEMVADILTKPLGRAEIEKLRSYLVASRSSHQ